VTPRRAMALTFGAKQGLLKFIPAEIVLAKFQRSTNAKLGKESGKESVDKPANSP